MKLNRKLILIISLALSLALATGGTLAYLSDSDADVNVMTLGSVHIAQHEYERVVDENGEYVMAVTRDASGSAYQLQPFTQGKPAFPAVYSDGKMAWDAFMQPWAQVGAPGSNDLFAPTMKNVIDKFVFVENTGKSDAYYRTIIAIECPEGLADGMIHTSFNSNDRFDYNVAMDGVQTSADAEPFFIEVDGVRYVVFVATYLPILEPGEVSRPSLLQLYLDPKATNDDVALFGDTWEVLVVSQGVQAAGFADAYTALEAGFGPVDAAHHPWLDLNGVEDGDQEPDFVMAATAEELTAALAAGKNVMLMADVELDAATAVTIPAGVKAEINLNGFTLSGVTNKEKGNSEMFLVKGELTVSGGAIEMEATVNQGWNAMTTIFNVTAGGVLNVENATLTNLGGTDMTFCVHLNNWGEVTLNVNKSTLTATYCAVRVFNSGYDMNNVTIRNSTLHGNNRAFWVHNYIGDLNSAQHSDAAIQARLNIDLINGTNTITNGTADAPKNNPIRYGFGNQAIYYDAEGNDVTVR